MKPKTRLNAQGNQSELRFKKQSRWKLIDELWGSLRVSPMFIARNATGVLRSRQSVKKVAGKVTSDVELEADGKVDNVVGKV
jgi:hypothetical protein